MFHSGGRRAGEKENDRASSGRETGLVSVFYDTHPGITFNIFQRSRQHHQQDKLLRFIAYTESGGSM